MLSYPNQSLIKLSVGARSSPLSKIQVQEVWEELKIYYPSIEFQIHYVTTIGDRDRETSLRDLDKTDFFTRDIDQLLLQNKVRIGIHSAKDLPSPLPKGLEILYLTEGIDSSDSLVLREGETLGSLPIGSCVATSSVRREEMTKLLRSDFTFKDMRGTIGERLEQLKNGLADGVVIAEAALIRLGLTHLNRIKLPGETVEGQGRLALVGRSDDIELKRFFLIDSNKGIAIKEFI
jgi:hydroxymethylbilane synthase